jgi:hypothetical protein
MAAREVRAMPLAPSGACAAKRVDGACLAPKHWFDHNTPAICRVGDDFVAGGEGEADEGFKPP